MLFTCPLGRGFGSGLGLTLPFSLVFMPITEVRNRLHCLGWMTLGDTRQEVSSATCAMAMRITVHGSGDRYRPSSICRMISCGSAPVERMMAKNSTRSIRRSPRSYFDTNGCGAPSRWAKSTCVSPCSFRAAISSWQNLAYRTEYSYCNIEILRSLTNMPS